METVTTTGSFRHNERDTIIAKLIPYCAMPLLYVPLREDALVRIPVVF